MYDVRRLDDKRDMVGGTLVAGCILPMLVSGPSLFLTLRKAMPESGISEKVTKLSTARQLTEHDRRLYMDDAFVHNLATHLAKAMQEYGVPKVAAAFRAALIFHANERGDGR